MTDKELYEQIEKRSNEVCARLEILSEEVNKLDRELDNLDSKLMDLMEKKSIRFTTKDGKKGTITGQGDGLDTLAVMMDDGRNTELDRSEITLIEE